MLENLRRDLERRGITLHSEPIPDEAFNGMRSEYPSIPGEYIAFPREFGQGCFCEGDYQLSAGLWCRSLRQL
jgi:hypothetical protein